MNHRQVATFFLLVGLQRLFGVTPAYWVSDGASLLPAYDDPDSVSADHWEFWLYRRGEFQVDESKWGSIEGKTPDAAKQKLETQRKFEKAFERFFKTEFGPQTFFNAKGPVAIVRPPPHRLREYYDRFNESYEVLQSFYDAYRTSTEILAGGGDNTSTPFSNTAEYLRAIKDGFDRASELHTLLSSPTAPALASLDREFALVDESLQRARVADSDPLRWIPRAGFRCPMDTFGTDRIESAVYTITGSGLLTLVVDVRPEMQAISLTGEAWDAHGKLVSVWHGAPDAIGDPPYRDATTVAVRDIHAVHIPVRVGVGWKVELDGRFPYSRYRDSAATEDGVRDRASLYFVSEVLARDAYARLSIAANSPRHAASGADSHSEKSPPPGANRDRPSAHDDSSDLFRKTEVDDLFDTTGKKSRRNAVQLDQLFPQK